MKLVPILILALGPALLLCLPFEIRRPGFGSPSHPTTLAGVAGELLRGVVDEDAVKAAASIAAVAGFLCVFAPLLVYVEARTLPVPVSGNAKVVLVFQGLGLLLATAGTFIVMVFNNMAFGFGASQTTEPTAVFVIILGVQGVCGLFSLVAGYWPALLEWAHRVAS